MFYNGFFGFSILDIPFWVEMAMSYGLIKSGNKIRSIGFSNYSIVSVIVSANVRHHDCATLARSRRPSRNSCTRRVVANPKTQRFISGIDIAQGD